MMSNPENFYETNLKGKNADQIMTTIRGLKQEIGKLKNIVEHPEYQSTLLPSEKVRISCNRDYLERAKRALEEIGGAYVPSIAEKKAMEFEENVPFISKIEFHIGGYFSGYETKTYIFDRDKICTLIDRSSPIGPSDVRETTESDKDSFLDELMTLHIGEWRKHYDTRRFGYVVCDGTQWHLEIYFSNGYKPVKIYGDNAYPYNFDRVLELFEIKY